MKRSELKNIFVTTGTTEFKSLITNILLAAEAQTKHSYVVQSPKLNQINFDLKVQNIEFIEWYEDFSWVNSNFDMVVSHAGAGTVYKCLEHNMRLLVVPNMDRKDKHQVELCSYLEISNYAHVIWGFENLASDIEVCLHTKFTRYQNHKKFDIKMLEAWING